MATACRENLIRNSVLSTKKLSVESENIPLVVSVQGGYKNSKGKYSVLSSYEQTLSLVTLLKAKGVNNIYLRYNGLYDDANNGSSDALGDFSKKLGKEKDYNALYNYLNSQKFLLFIETDLLTYDYNGKGAKSVDGSKYKVKYDDIFPNPVSAQEFIKLSKLENRVEEILNASADLNFDGYAFNDIGAELYSDYSSDFYSRVSAKKEISAQIPVLTTSKQIMVDTGNIYSVKNADIVTKLSITPVANKENGAYVGIPFMQMLLHGISAYSSDGINSYNDMKTAFLKCVEYGCLPSARWYCTQLDNETDKKFYYDNNINDMVNYYTKINDALGNIQASRMTSHYKVQNGLYCTEYDNSIKVYVNYTDKDITINGIKIPSMDCVKI